MLNSIKALLCFALCYSMIFSAGCSSSQSSTGADETSAPAATAPQTTQAVTDASTSDTASKSTASYNYMRIKEKSDDIMSGFDSYLISHDYNGTVYCKVGNDFEYIGGNGMAVVDKHTSNSVNTAYYSGSLTKQFTAAAVLLLAEQGKLSLDDNLSGYYPSYEKGESITIYNLLTMTSGIKSYMSADGCIDSCISDEDALGFDISADNTGSENKTNILNWIFSQELLFEPDTQFKLSDSNYYILGDIIEQASGESYEDFVTENILIPLSMNITSFESSDSLAQGYDGEDSPSWIYYPGAAYSSCGMITTVSDLLKWITALDEYEILSEESVEIMFTPYKENYGCGMFVNGDRAYQTFGFGRHSGMLSYTRDEAEIFATFTNYKYCEPLNVYGFFKKSMKPYEIAS